MKKLKKGEVIIFPTDTVPGIGCLLGHECIKKLRRITRRPENKPFAILLSNENDINKWVLDVPDRFHPLKNFIPGPLTLIFKGKKSLPEGVLSNNNKVGIRIPDYKPIQDLLAKSGLPLIATSANISGKPAPKLIEDVELVGDRVIEGYGGSGRASTVLDISEEKPILLRRGEISIIEIEKRIDEEVMLSKGVPIHILYVCSANMCRSPMAEAHLRSITSDLPDIKIRSAGTLAVSGAPLSRGARIILAENNIDVHHSSARVVKPILEWADIIFIMEKEHKDYILELLEEVEGKIAFLRNFKTDSKPPEIEDPIGKDIEVYREVYSDIESANKRIEEYLRRKIKN